MIDIRTLTSDQLTDALRAFDQPGFRADQVEQWLWQKDAATFDEMTNLPKALRETLTDHYAIHKARPDVTQRSSDGTIKIAFRLHDDRLIEGVMIPAGDRMTACVSSQVGCTLACSFCATGQLKRERNLTAGEIVDQVVSLDSAARDAFGTGLTNIVYMGMGEPLLNYDNVVRSIRWITRPDGLGMSPRRITVSTVGVARGITRLADEGLRINLAFSLHAPENDKRTEIMHINKSNSIEDVMDAVGYFYRQTGNKVTFEYVLLDGVNDGEEDAEDLAKWVGRVPAFVNLIEFNPVEGITYRKADPARRDRFVEVLESKGVTAKVRVSRGEDIDAACGQLAGNT